MFFSFTRITKKKKNKRFISFTKKTFFIGSTYFQFQFFFLLRDIYNKFYSCIASVDDLLSVFGTRSTRGPYNKT